MAIIKTAKNEHTLQYIKTRAANDNYRDNYDRIFKEAVEKDHRAAKTLCVCTAQ